MTLLFAIPTSAADADVANGLKNLAELHDLARIFELRHAMAKAPLPPERLDPWGTPYRIREDSAGYRIIGAGSDKTFDELSWKYCEQFDGTEGDVIFESGAVCRTNRHWLYDRIGSDLDANAALEELRRAEVQFMIMRTPVAQALTLAKLTAAAMEGVGSLVETHRTQNGDLTKLERATDSMAALVTRPVTGEPHPLTHDAWGTPFRLMVDGSSYRIISAGADREFQPATWSRAALADVAEDIVFSNGKIVRSVPEAELLDKGRTQVTALKQPGVPPAEPSKYVRVDSSMDAPVVIGDRVEPLYPDTYRRLRISGLVILELSIDEKGVLQRTRVLKSIAPDIDMSAVAAVKQWKFRPAMRDGKPVAALYNLTVSYMLK